MSELGSAPIAGIHSVRMALKGGAAQVTEVWLEGRRRDRRLAEVAALAEESGVRLRQVARAELDEACDGLSHQGVLAWLRPVAARREAELRVLLDGLRHAPFLLLLDAVQDPHNLGACLRSADAAGVHAVIAPGDRAVGLTPTVRKVASGAAETVAFYPVTNLARQLRELQQRGIWIVGTADDTGDSLYDCDLRGPLALVMGAEERGLRRLTREYCDRLVQIPMAGSVSSLNVSVATGIVLFEAVRQRRVTHNDQNKSPATQ